MYNGQKKWRVCPSSTPHLLVKAGSAASVYYPLIHLNTTRIVSFFIIIDRLLRYSIFCCFLGVVIVPLSTCICSDSYTPFEAFGYLFIHRKITKILLQTSFPLLSFYIMSKLVHQSTWPLQFIWLNLLKDVKPIYMSNVQKVKVVSLQFEINITWLFCLAPVQASLMGEGR